MFLLMLGAHPSVLLRRLPGPPQSPLECCTGASFLAQGPRTPHADYSALRRQNLYLINEYQILLTLISLPPPQLQTMQGLTDLWRCLCNLGHVDLLRICSWFWGRQEESYVPYDRQGSEVGGTGHTQLRRPLWTRKGNGGKRD